VIKIRKKKEKRKREDRRDKYKDNSMSRDLAHGYHHQLTLGQKTVGKRMPRVADDETFVSDSWTSICLFVLPFFQSLGHRMLSSVKPRKDWEC